MRRDAIKAPLIPGCASVLNPILSWPAASAEDCWIFLFFPLKLQLSFNLLHQTDNEDLIPLGICKM